MYICRTVLEESLPKIGMEFGGKDHTTVMHSVDKIKKEITKVLVTFSIGKIPSTTILSEEQIIEITKLWSNNIYEY